MRFPERRPPSKSSIKGLIDKIKARRTVENQNAGRSGRNRTTQTGEVIENVSQTLIASSSLTAWKNGLGIPRSLFNKITRHDPNYKICVIHELKPRDYSRRINYSRWILAKFDEADFLSKVVIGDEAGFSMNGAVNTHNVRSYAPKGAPPDFTYDHLPMSRNKVTVWAALCGNGSILSPFFFDENVNGKRYLNMINESVVPEMVLIFNKNLFAELRYDREVWWFQDGAPCHQRRTVSTRLEELFGDQVVALHRPTKWPPRSPDLTSLRFFSMEVLEKQSISNPTCRCFYLATTDYQRIRGSTSKSTSNSVRRENCAKRA